MSWNKITIQRKKGDRVEAQAPLIVSASRSTDISAFYARICDYFEKNCRFPLKESQISCTFAASNLM